MKRYYITMTGTTIAPHDPGFATKREARKELSAVVAFEVKMARRRFGTAVKSRTWDCVTITARRDPQSALWSRVGITSF